MIPFLQIEPLKCFTGEKEKLGNAEKFVLQLIQISGYRCLIDGLILSVDFDSSYLSIHPGLSAIHTACVTVLHEESFPKFLRFILHTGNFMNSVRLSHP